LALNIAKGVYMDSILNTVKLALGVEAEYNGFDINILLDINSAIFLLNQLGVGPTNGFIVKGENETWQDLLGDSQELELAKSYVVNNVRLSFDPPSNSFLVQAIQQQITEQAWRLTVQTELPVHVNERVLLNKKSGMSGDLRWAIDYGSHALNGLYSSAVILGGPTVRAWFDGGTGTSLVDIYTPELADLWDGDEFSAIMRLKVNSAADWLDGAHQALSLYTFPFINDFTININNAGNAIEETYMFSAPPFNLTRTVACNSLGWMTTGVRASALAGEFFFDLNGVQQGGSVGNPLWTGTLGQGYCRIGDPKWHGWIGDTILSLNGRVANSLAMLFIHNKLEAGTLTNADLNDIFGIGNYTWWKLNEVDA
jgi:hypothetical protein